MCQGSILSPVVFNNLISGLCDRAECTLSRFACDTKLGGAGDMLAGHAASDRLTETS